ncbi:nitroreductase [Blastococcus sp. TF02A-26]|uniref:Acg family FMN-binding oxidoreductase n=1 Tax=Blastococcus sp. TF02A-26 TaxID=2250577 RepID=UPI000DE96A5F|nr:nitroreductase [Blastococcus sp. TF02A-26]RBY80809.1 nitroreductase [Blastococcus sp. TF02A-26]
MPPTTHQDPPPSTGPISRPAPSDALEDAADAARLAPSVHNTQPWRLVLHGDRLELHADRTRQLLTLDPVGRALAQSVGAALFNARVSLAASGWATAVERLPDPADPDLLAVVRLVEGPPDPELAALAPAVPRRRTNRRAFTAEEVPEELLRDLAGAVAAEGARLLPLSNEAHRALVARLTQQADAVQNADPAYRAELRRWTTRSAESGDGVPASVVPHVDGRQHDDVPIRDFDTAGAGALPPETHSTSGQTIVLLATPRDDQAAWLRAGEALERLELELTGEGWAASPLTQAVEVPLTRTQLRSALTWDSHPQMLLRIGRAAASPSPPHRLRDDVVENSSRPPEPAAPPLPSRLGWPAPPAPAPVQAPEETPARRPVSDGRGGTTWV